MATARYLSFVSLLLCVFTYHGCSYFVYNKVLLIIKHSAIIRPRKIAEIIVNAAL